jgi:large subunit ribosomal protein L6
MSRLAKKEIQIPAGVDVKISDGILRVKGPKGELSRNFRPDIAITVASTGISLSPVHRTLSSRTLWGTYASHIMNMIEGVTKGFSKRMFIEGTGYKTEVSGNTMTLSVGFSHPVKLPIPKGVEVKSEKGEFTISGFDKELVSGFAAKVRSQKKPEPYKGKGIRYEGEVIARKQGKKSTT